MSTQVLIQTAEQYLAETETYEAATLKRFAQFLGVSYGVVYRWLPIHEWQILRNKWIQTRIRRTIDTMPAEVKTQEGMKVEYIASSTCMPLSIVRRFLTEIEGQVLPSGLSPHPEQPLTKALSPLTSQYMIWAESFLEQAKTYNEVTRKHLADFLGVTTRTLCLHIPPHIREMLREAWIRKHLQRVLKSAYESAKTQVDFSLEHIADLAGMSLESMRRFLPLNDWQTLLVALPPPEKQISEEAIRCIKQAEGYLAQTRTYENVTKKQLAAFLGIPEQAVHTLLPPHLWNPLRDAWLQNSLRSAIDTAYAEAKTQREFSIKRIARLAGVGEHTVLRHLHKGEWETRKMTLPAVREYQAVLCNNLLRQTMDTVYGDARTREDFTMNRIARAANIPYKSAFLIIGKEWQARRLTLPTTKEKVLAALQKLAQSDIQVSELTKQHVMEVAGVNKVPTGAWFEQAYRVVHNRLVARSGQQEIEPPSDENVRIIPGGWVDINEDTWDFRPAGNHLLSRKKLRADLAEVAWQFLQKELRSPEIALGTIDNHFQGFSKVGTLLGNEVPDVHRATLEGIQRAWMNCNVPSSLLARTRFCLIYIFEAIVQNNEHDDIVNKGEMQRISAWLRNAISIGRTEIGEDFFSEGELDTIIQRCLMDIVAGIAYINTAPDLLSISSRSNYGTTIARWAIALMILIMAFTGLRRESVLYIKTNDWAEIRTGLFALAWHHNKKSEENAAVLPASLAQQLQLYVQHTTQLRDTLQIEYVFLGPSLHGYWQIISKSQFYTGLHSFAKRHHLERRGTSLLLNSTVFRRTYTTLTLYEGRSLAAGRSELGHIHFESTLRYAKFDMYEHPAEVNPALDEFGRKALTLWHQPQLLNELNPDERASLLGSRVKQYQDVGLCRHDHCVKCSYGSPPPCALCEHLVTGPEFFGAWEAEYRWRLQELERLAAEPNAETVLAQMKYQFKQFETNFLFVQGKTQS